MRHPTNNCFSFSISFSFQLPTACSPTHHAQLQTVSSALPIPSSNDPSVYAKDLAAVRSELTALYHEQYRPVTALHIARTWPAQRPANAPSFPHLTGPGIPLRPSSTLMSHGKASSARSTHLRRKCFRTQGTPKLRYNVCAAEAPTALWASAYAHRLPGVLFLQSRLACTMLL